MKTGLVLSGGGSRGAYQIGVWKALRELDIHPDVITGTSVGALNGALMVQDSYDIAVNLWESLDTTAIFDFSSEPNFLEYAKAFFKEGGICRNGLAKLIKTHLREEHIRASRINLGMVLVRKQDLSPYQVFLDDIPKGMLAEYLMATTACFPAAKCHTISGVDYIDGGYYDNLPIQLAKSQAANKVIAVSLNPTPKTKPPFSNDNSVTVISPKWDLGNWLIFHKENTGRNIRLGYLDAMKAFGRYEGDAFTFRKDTFRTLIKKRQVTLSRWQRFLKANALLSDNSVTEILKESAEITGKTLRISPYRLYSADSFLQAINRKRARPSLSQKPSAFQLASLFLEDPRRALEFRKKYPNETASAIFLSAFA